MLLSNEIYKLSSFIIESKRDIYFHGSKGRHLRSILKHGLLPENTKPNFEDEDFINGDRSSKTFGGIYLTQDLYTASSYTENRNLNEPGVLITITLDTQLKHNILIDEDDILLYLEFNHTSFLQNKHSSPFNLPNISMDTFSNTQSFFNGSVFRVLTTDTNHYCEKFKHRLMEKLPKIIKDFQYNPGLEQRFLKQVDLVYKSLALHYLESLFNTKTKYFPELVKPKELIGTYNGWKDSHDMLLKMIPSAVSNPSKDENIRWFSPITYRGRNRILGVISFLKSGRRRMINIEFGSLSDNKKTIQKVLMSNNIDGYEVYKDGKKVLFQ